MHKYNFFANFLLLTLPLLVVACGKEQGSEGGFAPSGPDAPIEKTAALLTVQIEGPVATRSTSATGGSESRVNDLQIYVFDDDRLDGYGHVRGSLSGGVSCTAGKRDIFALVNAPEVNADSISTRSQFLSLVQVLDGRSATGKYLNEGADNFIMCGCSVGVTVAVSATVVPVTVNRYASRIAIEKITRKMEDGHLQSLPASRFCITRIFLANVRRDCATDPDGGRLASKGWLNASFTGGGAMTTDFPLICDAPSAYIADGQTYAKAHSFYAYPNDAATPGVSDGKTTRLVVELRIDDKFYTYPLEIRDGDKGIRANTSYRITELTVSHLGNPSNGDDVIDPGEDEPVTPVTLDYSVTVGPWDVVLMTSEGQDPGHVVI